MIRVSASVLVAVFCLTAASPADDTATAFRKCQKALGIADVQSIMNSQSMSLNNVADETGRCFIECLMNEFGVLKGDGLDKGKVSEQVASVIDLARSQGKEVNKDQLTTDLMDCGNQGGDGKCMKSYNMWVCLNTVAQQAAGLPG